MTTQLQGGFIQWSADNVDHNIRALSGKRSLHVLGIVCSITSQSGNMSLQTSLLKKEKVQSVKDIIKNKESIIKGALSGLRQLLTTESPLKIMKNAF